VPAAGVIDAVAAAAEDAGFVTLWTGEHVVMVDEPASRYPYADDGQIAVPAQADWLDPMIALSFAGAATSTIGLATGVMLLPEHNPVVVAKQAASLDVLCNGRLTLGIGVGWSRDEFDALGVPFEGEFARFRAIRVNPKPVRGRIAVVLGGNTDAALRRAAAWGDGWYGFNLADVEATRERVGVLHALTREAGRDPAALEVAVALTDVAPEDAAALADAGVTQLVLVASPPDDPHEAREWTREIGEPWHPVASRPRT
jgi:alkanesulfonate monooxygenase SsuD/methylene tetrahydromethanopterin reductase-like flavin-dependent oxidoreductase (luciferase family)